MSKKFIPAYTVTVYEYADRVVGNCICNKCNQHFTIELKGSPEAMKHVKSAYKVRRLFQVADERHDCPVDIQRTDKAETNRIVNKYHEYKLKQIKDGVI